MQNALLFIPDISGFTEFVHHTEISHSRHIISELLEILIDSNAIDLKLAEVEGDALFFYKIVDDTDIDNVKKQIRDMYIAFHTHLKRYEYERICHCGACSSAYNLTLKFVTHFGEIDFIKIKDSKKPYGSNVIQVHRLLKNNVPLSEYAIFTTSLLPLDDISNEEQSTKTIAEYDFGDITYTYNGLSRFKEQLPYVPPVPKEVPRHKLLSKTEIIKSPMLDLYEVISNFDYRLLWIKGVDELEYEKNKVNRAGQKHKCLIASGQVVDQTTVTKKVADDELVYGESTQEIPFTKRVSIYYVLKKQSEDETLVNIEVFADFKPFGWLFKGLLKKNFKKNLKENIQKLNALIDSGFTTKNVTIS
jgi:hypothetical protein